ncbi:unnamed protein product [Rotaria sp. Silwood1]|nr:unnamed protein product [Rotaria sp. Silwood1]
MKQEKKKSPQFRSVIFGPTCDSLDCIAHSIDLPLLDIGDILWFPDVGSYTNAKQIHLNKIQFLSWFKQSIFYSIPAILYFINNNLAVHIQIYMDPTSYQILSNFKILTTAILYRLIMKKRLIKQQWFALILLFFGGLTYSLGIPMIVIYCTLSGLAGVYIEWILKRYYSESLHLQNIFLYTYGTFLNLISAISMMITTSKTINNLNLFHDFTFYTWLIVITQVLNGLIMSVIIKYSSNIIRLFVISFSLIITAFLSFFIFHINFNIYFFISFVTIICAFSLYYAKSITSNV